MRRRPASERLVAGEEENGRRKTPRIAEVRDIRIAFIAEIDTLRKRDACIFARVGPVCMFELTRK